MFKSYTMELGGRPLTLEFGKYAEQASGSTFVRYGDTCVLVNATVADTPRPGIDFFPLSVDFEEKLYAVGHIPGSWNRREGRPAEKAILTSRLIDRPLRPLFPKGMRHDVAVVATVMSVDQDNIPDIPAMIGASAALSISEIPWAGPIGAVNIGYVDGEYVINPTVAQRAKSLMNLTVAGTSEAVLMVEAGAKDFRDLLSEISMLMAYEITRDLPTESVEIETPICKTTGRKVLGKKLAIVPILRAGLGMVDGFLSIVPVAKVGHIGLYRDPQTHLPVEYYFKMPQDISERTVILLDPMLATGGSASAAIDCLKARGCHEILLMNLVAAPEGIEVVSKNHPDVDIYVAAVDEKLNEQAYIVPGLGDAGDRLFGTK